MTGPAISLVIPWCDRREIGETLARNREELVRSGVDVLLVDCGGNESSLARLTRAVDLPRLRLARIDVSFNKSLALNLGAGMARSEVLSFLDADIVLRPGFFESMTSLLRTGTFVTVERVHESAAPEGTPKVGAIHEIAHSITLTGPALSLTLDTNRVRLHDGSRSGPGLIVVYRDDFVAVGGMNSDLEGWGWEDLDLVARLQLARGLEHRQAGSVLHLTHGDEARALHGGTRSETERLNFAMCIHNYMAGHYLGTYEDDMATWSERVAASIGAHQDATAGVVDPKIESA